MQAMSKPRSIVVVVVGSLLAAGALYVFYHLFLQFLLGLFQFQT